MLAQRSNLTKATVSAICKDLTALGLIRETGQDRSGIGRPGNLIELNSSALCAIGVDLGTNYAAVILTDLCGRSLWQSSALIPVGSNQETVLAQAEALIAEAIVQAGAQAIPLLGIGVGVPGIVDPGENNLVSAPALGWKEVPLKQIWAQRFSVPVLVENKARAAAMAEAPHGCAQEATSFVYVNIGTDVRSSVEAVGGSLRVLLARGSDAFASLSAVDYDLSNGEATPILDIGSLIAPQLSPDGRFIGGYQTVTEIDGIQQGALLVVDLQSGRGFQLSNPATAWGFLWAAT